MSSQVSESIYRALSAIRLVDPHSHINPHDPASHTLADLLGYHYYTELAHSAGMPKARIEDRTLGPKELVARLVEALPAIENTVQYRWLIELCRTFYGFDEERIDSSNWEALYATAEDRMKAADWPQMVLEQSNVEAVFLTNDFDDDLSQFDTETYVPCLRTDELVFHLAKDSVQKRLSECTGVTLDGSLGSLREALTRRFEYFITHGARACAISLPPTFEPRPIADGRATVALNEVLRRSTGADVAHRDALARRVFWTLAELCDQFGVPFDLMIGVNRGVYAEGVYQGCDLYDSRVSLIQYRELFNAFPEVKFPVSVLASVTNQELVSYAWIFPNVITHGHWWYSNTPSFIARDAAARLEAVPRTKQIGYYSDAYKLEFIWPKFDMYRRTLADLLAENFVRKNGWSEERAIELGRQILRGNVDEIFKRPDTSQIVSRQTEPAADSGDALGALSSFGGASVPWGSAEPEETDLDRFSTLAESPTEAQQRDEFESGLGAGFGSDAPEGFETIIENENETQPQNDRSQPFSALSEEDSGGASEAWELDATPSDDEVSSLPVDDVEIMDELDELAMLDSERIESEVDPEPLDVGDLTFDEDPDNSEPPQIRMLSGEGTFSADEDSFQMESNPTTGELIFPVEESAGRSTAGSLEESDWFADLDQPIADDQAESTSPEQGSDEERTP